MTSHLHPLFSCLLHRCSVVAGFAVWLERTSFATLLRSIWWFTMPPVPKQQIASQVARLPLAKFSHTTTSIDHSGPLSWIHINGHGGLVCLLDKFSGSPSTPSRLILRVLNNHGILVCSLPITYQLNSHAEIQSRSNLTWSTSYEFPPLIRNQSRTNHSLNQPLP